MSDKANSRRDFMSTTGAAAGLGALAAMFAGSNTASASIEGLNAMQPTPAQIQKFMALPDRPVVMVNLLKYKDAAEYQKYGVGVSKILAEIGAEIIFSGECAATMIGGAEWDAVAMVRYPNAQALIKMSQSPEYQAIHGHRAAGLDGQMNLAVFENAMPGAEAAADEGVTADQIMSQMDANKDGMIDMDEAPDQLKDAFGMVDMDGSGGIDLSEAQTIADFLNGQQ